MDSDELLLGSLIWGGLLIFSGCYAMYCEGSKREADFELEYSIDEEPHSF